MRNICTQYATIFVLGILFAVIFEFRLEGYLFPAATLKPFDVRLEYVLIIGFFIFIALVGPLMWTLKLEKHRKNLELDRDGIISELQESLNAKKRLEGIIPICSYCKKIRDGKGAWSQMEEYIRDHSDAEFSHGICPQCMSSSIEKI